MCGHKQISSTPIKCLKIQLIESESVRFIQMFTHFSNIDSDFTNIVMCYLFIYLSILESLVFLFFNCKASICIAQHFLFFYQFELDTKVQ